MSGPVQVVITMAGLGSRFRKVGYQVPKYRILARGRSLFDWSMESLRSFIDEGAHFIFVMREEDASADFVRDRAAALGIASCAIVEIDALTDGQATTALLAAPEISDPDAPFLIYNIDTHVDPSALPASAVRGEGWIPCFAAEGDAWSFVALGTDGRACEVREKTRISPHATIGLYYFASFSLYRSLYDETYTEGGLLEAGERYVAPMYNALIARGADVFIHDVPPGAFAPLGTPDEVLQFDPEASPDRVV
ncbi:MAG: glycosyltransferase family 2 protein [Hyphomonas sp.]|nr:glycosyltransferase family 2 protein [Hyphomonas sp.]